MTTAAILPLAATMESILAGVENGVLVSKMGAATAVGSSLAAAMAAVAIFIEGRHYLSGKAFDWWNLLKPVLLFIVVANFPTIVLNPVRAVAGVYNTRLADSFGSSVEEFKALFKEQAEVMCHEQFGMDEGDLIDIGEEDGWIARNAKKIANKLIGSYYGLNEKLNFGAAQIASGVMFFFLNMYSSIMIIISAMYMMVMALLGPVTFAIAIVPTYSGGIKLWLERYIQYTLWQPVIYLLMYLGTQIMIQGNQAVSWGGFWTWLFMCMSIFVMIKQTPGIASFIIEGTGVEALANKLSGLGDEALHKAGGMMK